MTVTVGWVQDHYTPGWYFDDDGSIHAEGDPEILALYDPAHYEEKAGRVRTPKSRLTEHGIPIFLCRACGEPSWAVTRHAAERHGADIEVMPPLPGKQRPAGMHPDWI